MSDVDLQELFVHRKKLASIAETLWNGLPAIDEIAPLSTALANDNAALAALAPLKREAVRNAFAEAANNALGREIAAMDDEKKGSLVVRIDEVMAVLVGQAIVQIVRSTDGVNNKLVVALGGLRDDFKAFRSDFALRLEAAGETAQTVRIDERLVREGAPGVRVREPATKEPVFKHQDPWEPDPFLAFSYVFRVLVDRGDDLFGKEKPDRNQLRTIAILTDTLVGGNRIDLADRLVAAKAELAARSSGSARAREAMTFCEELQKSTQYLELHKTRVALSGDKTRRSRRLLGRARRILLAEGRLSELWVRVQRIRGAWRDPPRDGLWVAAAEALRDRLKETVDRTHAAVRFPTLFRLEAAWLTPPNEDWKPASVPLPSTTREPRVAFPDRDYFGLALSGGGIRSATFNLGLLQALAEKGVLDHVDFVSTVSGGGYIGGFWTAWRHLKRKPFPPRSLELTNASREHPSVRHLREFSRFLIPRLGFAQTETWNAVVAVLGGVVGSLVFMSAAVAIVLWLGLYITCSLASLSVWPGALLLGAVTFAVHVMAERQLKHRNKLGDDSLALRAGVVWASVSGVLAVASWGLGSAVKLLPVVSATESSFVDSFNGFAREHAEPCSLAPAAVWGATALLFLLVRGFFSRAFRGGERRLSFGAALDRTAGRSLAFALIASAFAGIMWLACVVATNKRMPWFAAAGGSAGTAIFVWLRDWLKEPVRETRGSALYGRIVTLLKPVMPKVAANVAVILFFVGLGIVVRHFGFGLQDGKAFVTEAMSWRAVVPIGAAALIVIAAIISFDPARVGLHEFYRSRISRCFLGAAAAPDPWQTDAPRLSAATAEQPKDDLAFGDLNKTRQIDTSDAKGKTRNPIHLVCCAANNLSGDVLGSLYRGARSAVVSQFGVSVGDYSAPQEDLHVSAALTASAAAFNSQMGSVSMRVGPAVAFLMCVLNLRLGLWVPHPLNPRRLQGWAPGFYFLLEALGLSRSDQVADPNFRKGRYWRSGSKLHLSDGGHFENLALYELVRRHCRYVIVSDAGEDPKFRFDDLGNAVRRVREDFGVEIEIDVSPLRKGQDGFSSQHAVVGTIHYDGLDGTDKGLIIYFKPTITGDEPVDVLEHCARDPHFPHDCTGDQFYDEAQWESYRRIGQHCAAAVLALPSRELESNFVDQMFFLATQRWHPAKRDQDEVFLRLTDRCDALEAEIPETLLAEFFPEVAITVGSDRPADSPAKGAPSRQADATTAIHYLMRIIQVMEDVWLAANLEVYWSHPLNEGWMNYFQRWANTRSFRRWWPILRPIYGARFRDFVRERFDVQLTLVDPEGANPESHREPHLIVRPATRAQIASHAPPAIARRLPAESSTASLLAGELYLEDAKAGNLNPIVVGVLVYRSDNDVVHWNRSDLIIPAALQGAGITRRFLDGIVKHFRNPIRELRVFLDAEAREDGKRAVRAGPLLLSPADRAATIQTIAFYKSRGFAYQASTCSTRTPPDTRGLPASLHGTLVKEIDTSRATIEANGYLDVE